jgi:hypothetical protein
VKARIVEAFLLPPKQLRHQSASIGRNIPAYNQSELFLNRSSASEESDEGEDDATSATGPKHELMIRSLSR